MRRTTNFGDIRCERGFRLLAGSVAAGGLVISFVAFMPGLMTWDSFVLWNMAVEWKFHDWHHPFIAVLMAVGRVFRDDPSPYLFFQLALFWGGAYLYAMGLFRQVGFWAILVVLVAFLPFNVFLAGYLHKTPLLAACLLFASALLFNRYTKDGELSGWLIVPVVLLLFLGSVVRGYSYLAALPLLFFMFFMLLRRFGVERIRLWSAVLSIFTAVVFFFASTLLVHDVLQAKRTNKPQIVFKFDMAAIYALTGKAYAKRFLLPEYPDHDSVAAVYAREEGLWRISNVYRFALDKSETNEMRDEWMRAIAENPGVYLRHRIGTILKCLGATTEMRSTTKGFDANSPENKYNLTKVRSDLWRAAAWFRLKIKDHFYMLPWFWASLNLFFSVLALVLLSSDNYRAAILPHALVVWSGLILLVSYLPFCLAAEGRFTYWVTVATSVGGLAIACNVVRIFLARKGNSSAPAAFG